MTSIVMITITTDRARECEWEERRQEKQRERMRGIHPGKGRHGSKSNQAPPIREGADRIDGKSVRSPVPDEQQHCDK